MTCAGGHGGPPLRGGFGLCGQVLESSPLLCRRGLQRNPVESIVDSHIGINGPGTKKRRMLCIVVSRLPALFQRLMFLDYQIGLDFASGVGSWNVGKMVSKSAFA